MTTISLSTQLYPINPAIINVKKQTIPLVTKGPYVFNIRAFSSWCVKWKSMIQTVPCYLMTFTFKFLTSTSFADLNVNTSKDWSMKNRLLKFDKPPSAKISIEFRSSSTLYVIFWTDAIRGATVRWINEGLKFDRDFCRWWFIEFE